MNEPNRQQQAKKYERVKLLLSVGQSVISFLLMCVVAFGGYGERLRDVVSAYSTNPYVRFLLFTAVLGIVFLLIDLPISFISGYQVEHRYELSNQTVAGWLWEQTKALLLGIVLLVPLLLIFYYLLLHAPQTWWLWTSLVLFFFTIVLGRITPQLILPLFYKFEPLDEPQLLERMKNLAAKGGFELEGVYQFDMSKTTKKANAAFTGLGKSRRIILGDTLLQNYSLDEIETVFAHEVGHYVHKHLWWGLLSGTAAIFVELYLANAIYQWALKTLHFTGPADLAALPLLSVILSVLTLIFSPLTNMLARRFERQADAYAVLHSANPEAFISALEKLAEQNLTDREPHPLVEFLFHAHPSLSSRVNSARELIAKIKNQGIGEKS